MKQYFVEKINIGSFLLIYIQTIYTSFESCFVLCGNFTSKNILREKNKYLFLLSHDCKNSIFIFSLCC